MMEGRAAVLANTALSPDIYKLKLDIPSIAAGAQAGQFVHLEVPGLSLRRPFTVADADGTGITLVIRRQGRGTDILAASRQGDYLQVLGPLGNGFSPGRGPALLLGGGIGAAALTLLARRLSQCTIVMGARSRAELWLDQLDLPGTVEIQYATDDGSRGFHGNLVQYAQKHLQPGMWVAACGPEVMLQGVQKLLLERRIEGQFALEQRMACGIGACMGCTCKTVAGNALVCKDGPVFDAREVVLT